MLAFTDVLGLKHYALYVLTTVLQAGFRLAIARPERVTAIISQNGNAYEDGLGGAWTPFSAIGGNRRSKIVRLSARS